MIWPINRWSFHEIQRIHEIGTQLLELLTHLFSNLKHGHDVLIVRYGTNIDFNV